VPPRLLKFVLFCSFFLFIRTQACLVLGVLGGRLLAILKTPIRGRHKDFNAFVGLEMAYADIGN